VTADASTRGKRNRRYGHDTELMVANYLARQGWPDACTTRAKLRHAGTRTPGDIDWHPLITLEVKGRIETAWPTWCRQAAAEAPPGTVPVVVRRTRGVTDVGLWECRYQLGAWMDVTAGEGWCPSGLTVRIDGATWVVTDAARLVAAVRALDAEGAS
jgi:hypothetical protein